MNNQEKKKQAEKQFQSYLNKNNIPYWYIQQDLPTYSPALKELNIQRPDFLILIPHLGFILIDVELREPLEKYQKFCLCNQKAKKYENLLRYFNLPMWYAFSNNKINYSTWYFISIATVIERRKRFLVKEKQYLSVPIKDFIPISTTEKITKLFQSEKSHKLYKEEENPKRYYEAKFT